MAISIVIAIIQSVPAIAGPTPDANELLAPGLRRKLGFTQE
jgi:hypothetical protein